MDHYFPMGKPKTKSETVIIGTQGLSLVSQQPSHCRAWHLELWVLCRLCRCGLGLGGGGTDHGCTHGRGKDGVLDLR